MKPTLVKMVFGSHLYGLNTPESDTDYKGVFLPTPREIILERTKHAIGSTTGNRNSKNGADDIDYDQYSLLKFTKLLMDGETMAIDMIHARGDAVLETSEIWQYIHDHRAEFYTTEMTSYLGYVRRQAGKYGVKGSRMSALRKVVDVLKVTEDWIPEGKFTRAMRMNKVRDIAHLLPVDEYCKFVEVDEPKTGHQHFYEVLGRKFQMTITIAEMKKSLYKLWDEYGDRARKAEANEGIDWKALSHALRGGFQLQSIYQTGDIIYPLVSSDLIMKVKTGRMPFKEVQQLLEEVVDTVDREAVLAAKNGMRKHVDRDRWSDWLYDVHADHLRHALFDARII